MSDQGVMLAATGHFITRDKCEANYEPKHLPHMSAYPEATVVYLRTGSPPLVTATRNDDCVSVVWFDGLEVRRDTFHQDALTTEKPETK